MAEDRSQTLTFLYKVIDDNQATIRFLDTKAAFGIAVLGAIVGKLLDRDQLVACESHGFVVMVISTVFALLVVTAATLGYKTVFPMVNPAQKVSTAIRQCLASVAGTPRNAFRSQPSSSLLMVTQ